ncbi:MAG: YlbD family protein [Defluviitaleaceae bacterium]|nr:YlbD family protein [Defluviitaleaceae bacterium]
MEKIDAFKAFVRRHPGLKEEVRSGKSTWQNVYESWYLYGADDGQWEPYKAVDASETEGRPVTKTEGNDPKSELSGPEMMAQAFEYLQKVDIDKVQKTMGTFQQFIQIFQTMQAGKNGGHAAGSMLGRPPKQNYSGFFSQFDD